MSHDRLALKSGLTSLNLKPRLPLFDKRQRGPVLEFDTSLLPGMSSFIQNVYDEFD